MENTLPKFMTEKRDIARFLAFVIFWVAVFMFIYRPNVTIKSFEHLSHGQSTLYLWIMIAVGFIVLVGSRIAFYQINKRRGIPYKYQYVWIVAELLLIPFALSLFPHFLGQPNPQPYFTVILPRVTLSVDSILIIPYIICWLYFSLEERNHQLKEIKNNRQIIMNRETINFNDEKGVFRLSVRLDDLLYIQSADNYVFIYYLNGKKEIVKFMLRNTLKYVEENFPEMQLVRCHRFYVVNLKKVRVLRKGKEGLILELDTMLPTEIPVSKTYSAKIAELFSQI